MLITKKLNYADYILFPENGYRHEIIDGDHFMIPAPSYRHQKISREIEYQFHTYFKQSGTGEILYAPFDVLLSDFDIVQPDIVIICIEWLSIVMEKNIQGVPDMIIEILSLSTKERDIRLKKDLYEKYGVKVYWTVNPWENRIDQFILIRGFYELQGGFDSLITPSLFPDIIIDLADVFF